MDSFKHAAQAVRAIILAGDQADNVHWLMDALSYRGHQLIRDTTARQRGRESLISNQVMLTLACEPSSPLERKSV